VLEALAGSSATASASGKDGAWRVVATVPAGSLAATLSALASLPEVEAIEPARTFRLFNQDAVWVHQSFVGPPSQQTPVFARGIFGCGQIVAVADSAQDYDSCFFRDTVAARLPSSPVERRPAPPCAGAHEAQGHHLLQLVGRTDRRGGHLPCLDDRLQRARHAHVGIGRG
jgi:hypothetical protein